MSGDNERLNEGFVEVIRGEKIPHKVRLKKAKYMIALGADVNAKLFGKSALSWAKAIGDEELAKFLEEKGAKEFEISKEEALSLGKELVDTFNYKNGKEKIVDLIKKGADVNERNSIDRTVLMLACSEKNVEEGVVKMIIQRGAHLDAVDCYGESALMKAALKRNRNMVKLLLDEGADVNIKDCWGRTVLMCAVSDECIDLFNMMIEKGADINTKDEDNETLLMKAVRGKQVKMVEMLIEKGVDVEVKCKDGMSALDIALERGDMQIAGMIKKVKEENAQKKKIKFWGNAKSKV